MGYQYAWQIWSRAASTSGDSGAPALRTVNQLVCSKETVLSNGSNGFSGSAILGRKPDSSSPREREAGANIRSRSTKERGRPVPVLLSVRIMRGDAPSPLLCGPFLRCLDREGVGFGCAVGMGVAASRGGG